MMTITFRRQLTLQARDNFFLRGEQNFDIFSEDIYDSWQRSLDYGLDPNYQIVRKLSPDELAARKNKNKLLLNIVNPFMDFLYDLVQNSGFVICFADSDGYILRVIGDADALEDIQSKENPLVEGVCRHESVFGTGGIGTPLALRKPMQFSSFEMFYPTKHEFTGTGAPLIDDSGVCHGVICMSTAGNHTHSHTLGLVAASSYAIMRQYSLKILYDRLAATESQLQTIISTINQGLLLLDENLLIIKVNDAALKALGFTKTEILGLPISKIIPGFDFKQIRKPVFDRELSIQGKYSAAYAFATIQPVKSNVSNDGSLLITFRHSTHMRKFVTQYIGATASFTFDNIIGESSSLATAKNYAQIASGNSANVLLLGESGTGKELFAQAIHNSSSYASGPFIAINCGAIPKSLIESELFGYEAGSFTGAKREGNAGKFELANNGTIFLDEIGDMPYEAQVHLLRILQTKEVTRIGGKKPIPLNIRIIAGTNVDLQEAIQEKTFRSDLYYRLNVLPIQIPTLRERKDDIPLLADYFIKKYQPANKAPIEGLTNDVLKIFIRYPWPGNIRELENTIERACLLTTDTYISVKHITPSILHYEPPAERLDNPGKPLETVFSEPPTYPAEPVPPAAPTAPAGHSTIENAEQSLILHHLTSCRGNVKQAAIQLGISRRTLYRKMEKYGIDRSMYDA